MFTNIETNLNMGGVVAASFVYISDIADAYKLPDAHKLHLILANGKIWNPIYNSPGAELSEEISDEDAGNIFIASLKIRYPRISPEISHQQRLVQGQKIIVRVLTSNGDNVYIGTPWNPAQYQFNKLIGGSAAAFCGYLGVFKSAQPYSMLFVE